MHCVICGIQSIQQLYTCCNTRVCLNLLQRLSLTKLVEMAEVQYSFVVENYDTQSNLTKQYKLLYWPNDQSVELYDIKLKRLMLKRTVYPSVTLSQLYVGNTISVYARQYKLLQYADKYTETALSSVKTSNFIIVKNIALQYIGTIIDILLSNNTTDSTNQFVLTRIGMVTQLNESLVTQIVGSDNTIDSIEKKNVINDLVSLPVVLIELIGHSTTLKNLLNNLNATDAELLRNVVYVDTNLNQSANELFNTARYTSLYLQQSDMPYTICIIKPHVVTGNLSGKIIDDIQAAGYIVTGIKSVQLDNSSAEELCEVYKGVIPEYHALVQQYTQGLSIVLEVTRSDVSSVQELVTLFRKFIGPVDPEIGKHIRVDSLRARYGTNKVYNALHTTDLSDDTQLEAEYFFSIIA